MLQASMKNGISFVSWIKKTLQTRSLRVMNPWRIEIHVVHIISVSVLCPNAIKYNLGVRRLKNHNTDPLDSISDISCETRELHDCRRGSAAQALTISIPLLACTSAHAAAIKTVLITHNLH